MALVLRESASSRSYPVVALREGVVFPHTEAPLTFGRVKSNSALEAASREDKKVVLVAQKNSENNPDKDDLQQVGTLCQIQQIVPAGNELWALVKGLSRVRILNYTDTEPYFSAQIQEIPDQFEENDKIMATAKQILSEFKRAFNLGKPVELPVFMRLMAGVSVSELVDQIANTLDINTFGKQEILEMTSVQDRLDKVLQHLVHETKVIELEQSISTKTHAKFDKNMREQILRERRKTIDTELEKLGADSDEDDDFADLRKKIKQAKMPIEVKKKAEKELSRLAQMSFNNPESNYIRTYLETLVEMPWGIYAKSNLSITKSSSILDNDHYGLKKVKERILEYLAVMKLRGQQKADGQQQSPTILCFVGPPGVGKTSIGKSIARALGRKFVRISLGGIRDEAEIRGHRRTYVGAMPGRIIQGIKNAKSSNPVFMLDEIDKIGADYRGDPSAALLEALDPEQNREFSDHYIEVPFDLSQVMFITTANILDTIPYALRDRLEIISFPGYTQEEKSHIATDYLWPKQVTQAGLPKNIRLSAKALNEIIGRYTREAGVRDVERQLAKICRKLARLKAENKKFTTQVDVEEVRKLLGPQIYAESLAEKKDEIGMSTGLAWTQAGGDIMFIEVAIMPGKGSLQLTGQLGDVMKESAQAAFSYVRSSWKILGLKEDFYKKIDIHIHVPEGAVPKDGPSAGLAMATALISALTKTPIRRDTAMTGEITLRGRALEIGGVKEKVIAAHRAGIKQLVLPKENKKDLEDVPASVKKGLDFHFVSHVEDVLKYALRTPLSSPAYPSLRHLTAVA